VDLNSFLQLVRSRRTIRRFRPEPLSDDLIEGIIEAGRWAPSGANSQPWEFVVVKSQETKSHICEILIQERVVMSQTDRSFPFQNEDALRAKYCEASALIIVCADLRLIDAYPQKLDGLRTLYMSIGACVENMHLAATVAGLGMSWGSVGELAGGKIKELLGIPSALTVTEVLSIGYPAEAPIKYKRSLNSLIHREKFESQKLRTDEEIKHLLQTRRSADIYSGCAP
jgi:5,6-dimethylbenzimidazole synthase